MKKQVLANTHYDFVRIIFFGIVIFRYGKSQLTKKDPEGFK